MNRKRFDFFTVLLPIALVFAAYSLAYGAVTGEAMWSNVTYETPGRVFNAIGAVLLIGMTIHFAVTHRRDR